MNSIIVLLVSILVLLGSTAVAAFTSGTVSRLLSPSSASKSLVSSSSLLRAVKEASFGMGCFWEPAESMLKVDGIIDTVSGYTGNKRFDDDKKKTVPSYENVCYGQDWVEGVQVTYDDNIISYDELLNVFFDKQKPAPQSRQYSSIIFPYDEEQYNVASTWSEQNKEINYQRESDGFKAEWTSIEYPRTKFYAAEGYHQGYWQKQRPRFALIFVLLAIASGILDPIFSNNESLLETIKNVANGSTVAIGLAITLERFLDSKVVEL